MNTPNKKYGHYLLHQMIRIRRLEEKCAELYSAGKIRGFLHLYAGEEAIAAGALSAINPDQNHDSIVSTYREHGHALMCGISMKRIMAELFGKSTGCSHGRGGSMHLYDAKKRFFGGQAIVGAGIPLSVGLGLADKMLKKKSIAICFFGDGATAEGVFHESLNLASLWKIPVLFLCENNQYAMGTSLAREHAQTNLSTIAAAHRIPSKQVDGMDVMKVHESVAEATNEIRDTESPRFLELLTYRFRAHSMYDPELYRGKDEVEQWKKRDPIKLFSALLMEQKLLTENEIQHMEQVIEEEINEAIEFADASPWEPVEDLMKEVYAPVPETEKAVNHGSAA